MKSVLEAGICQQDKTTLQLLILQLRDSWDCKILTAQLEPMIVMRNKPDPVYIKL